MMATTNPAFGQWQGDIVITPTQCNKIRMMYRYLPRREYPSGGRGLDAYLNKRRSYLRTGWTGFKRTYPTLHYHYVTDVSRVGLH